MQRGIRGIFGREKVQCHKPFEAVAHGALAFSLGLNIVDFIQHSYAIRYLDSLTKEPRYKIIFKAGSEYPSEKPVTLTLSSSFRNQKAIELMMAETSTSGWDGSPLMPMDGFLRWMTAAIPCGCSITAKIPPMPPSLPSWSRPAPRWISG